MFSVTRGWIDWRLAGMDWPTRIGWLEFALVDWVEVGLTLTGSMGWPGNKKPPESESEGFLV